MRSLVLHSAQHQDPHSRQNKKTDHPEKLVQHRFTHRVLLPSGHQPTFARSAVTPLERYVPLIQILAGTHSLRAVGVGIGAFRAGGLVVCVVVQAGHLGFEDACGAAEAAGRLRQPAGAEEQDRHAVRSRPPSVVAPASMGGRTGSMDTACSGSRPFAPSQRPSQPVELGSAGDAVCEMSIERSGCGRASTSDRADMPACQALTVYSGVTSASPTSWTGLLTSGFSAVAVRSVNRPSPSSAAVASMRPVGEVAVTVPRLACAASC